MILVLCFGVLWKEKRVFFGGKEESEKGKFGTEKCCNFKAMQAFAWLEDDEDVVGKLPKLDNVLTQLYFSFASRSADVLDDLWYRHFKLLW